MVMILAVLVGMFGGYWLLDGAHLPQLDNLIQLVLAVLLFTIGYEVAQDRSWWLKAWEDRKRAVLLPLAVVAASLLGGALAGLVVRLPLDEALVMGAGMGWYSMSAVLVGQSHGYAVGALAFLANLFRELTVLLAAPWLMRWGGKGGLIGAAGATAMDSTLPVIVRVAGSKTAVLSLVSGMILSLLVPFLTLLLVNIPWGGQ